MDIRITNETRQDLKVASIKQSTFRFFAAASEQSKLKQRGIFGSYIEFEYYTSNGFTVDYGDCLNVSEFVNVDKSFNDIYPSSRAVNMFPKFYVKEIKSRKNAVYVSAYDCASFLNVDYSQRLVSLQNSFPMTIGDLFDDVMQFAGLTTRMTNITLNWPAGQSIAASTINYFYSNGILARDIVDYISEMMGIGLRASSSTDLIKVDYQDSGNITAWLNVDEYVVCPDDGTYYQEDGVTQAVNIWYKENGLSISNVIFAYDGVEIISNDGQIVGSYYNVTPAQNIYKIYNNVIIGNVNTYDSYIINANEIAKLIYLQMSSAYPYVSATVSIFPFRNPYRIGTTARIIAPDGNYYDLPIMSLEITESGVVIESFGNSSEHNTNDGGGDKSLALDVRVTALESQKIDGYTLVNFASASAGTISTYNSRSFSDYIWLVAEWVVNSSIRATMMFRRADFENAPYVSLFYVDSANTQRWCELSYVDDTTLSITASSNASGNIALFGLALASS